MRSSEKQTVQAGGRGLPASRRAEDLLDGLEEIFLREGFRRVGVGELAARLHCSRRTLYALAPRKEDLFLRVLDRLLERIRRLGREAVASRADLRERLADLFAPGVSELRGASALFSSDVAGYPPARRALERHQRERLCEARELIEEGIRRGGFRGVHSHLAAEVVLAAVQHVVQPGFLREADLSTREAIAELESLILHGLLCPEGDDPG